MFVGALLVFFLKLCCYCQAIEVIVNCTWPCADNSQACVVNTTSIQCMPRRNSQWVLSESTGSPIFIGETARKNTPCITSPNPISYLPNDTTATQFDETKQQVITWPPHDPRRPLDEYLSDCDSSTYCNLSTWICVGRLAEDNACESTNQCMSGLLCIGTRCTGAQVGSNEGSDTSSTKVHKAIIAVVVVVAVLAIVAVICYRRKVLVFKKNKDTGSPPRSVQSVIIQPLPSSLLSAPPPVAIIGPTPTMQQRHLQYQLHRQHAPPTDIKDETAPPPPYSP